MNMMNCPYCQRPNRSGARFCTACGQDMQGNPRIGQSVADGAAHTVQATVPMVQEAVETGWAQGKRGAGWLRRVLTLGGRAAYAEMFSPEPALSGWVTTPPQLRTVQTPLEVSFFLFVVFVLFGWLVNFLPDGWPGVVLVVWLLAMLILNFLGLRRPFFTTLTWQRLFGRLLQVQVTEFYMQEAGSNRQLRVEMVGVKQPVTLDVGTFIQVYGVEQRAQTAVRAWWISPTSQDGQGQPPIHVPRLIPLSVALFFPFLLATLFWLIGLLWG